MSDLISRQAVIEAILDLPNRPNGFSDMYDKALIIAYLETVPTVDAVEVVRCKDCKHNSLNRKCANAYCNLGIELYQLDDYCSHGERRENDG